jgi:SAM-dependent methyltransferase
MGSGPTTGSGERWGRLWGTAPRDWSEVEDQQEGTYAAALERIELGPGVRVLDVGCGTGSFLAMVAARGAEPHGLDASSSLLEIARERLPGADLRRGDMQALPFEDGSFDVVTGFNSFFFATDMVAALREAGRVARPGGVVLTQVWGHPDACDLTRMLGAIASLRPGRRGGGPDLWRPGTLEDLARQAGLKSGEAFTTSYAIEYPDAGTMLRRLLSAGGVVEAVTAHGRDAVGGRILEALEPLRRDDGSYRLVNEWRYLPATA